MCIRHGKLSSAAWNVTPVAGAILRRELCRRRYSDASECWRGGLVAGRGALSAGRSGWRRRRCAGGRSRNESAREWRCGRRGGAPREGRLICRAASLSTSLSVGTSAPTRCLQRRRRIVSCYVPPAKASIHVYSSRYISRDVSRYISVSPVLYVYLSLSLACSRSLALTRVCYLFGACSIYVCGNRKLYRWSVRSIDVGLHIAIDPSISSCLCAPTGFGWSDAGVEGSLWAASSGVRCMGPAPFRTG